MITRDELVFAAAEKAAFYRDAEGKFFRMNFVDDDSFNVLDEDTGNTHSIYLSSFSPSDAFFALVEIEIPNEVKA